MAQQYYRPNRHNKKSDDNQGVYDDAGTYTPAGRSQQNEDVSKAAQNTLDNIDDALNEPSDLPSSKSEPSQSSAAEDSKSLAEQEMKGSGDNSTALNALSEENKKAGDGSPSEKNTEPQSKKRGWKGLSKKAKGGIIGGLTGLGIGGGIFGFTIISGPLEFVHLGEVLHNTHLAQQEDAGDVRTGRLIRGMREGNVGSTRVGWLGNKLYKNTIANLAEKGITPKSGALSLQEGMVIDTKSANSPYKGMTPENAANEFQKKLGTKVSYTIEGGKVTLTSDSIFGPRDINKLFLKNAGFSKVGYLARMRVLGKFGLVGFHNLGIDRAQVKGTGTLTEYFKDKWNKLFKGQDPIAANLDASKAKQQTGTDKNGNPITSDAAGPSGALESGSVRDTLQSIADSKGGKVTGGLAFAIGILCILKTVNDNIGQIRYVQMIKPLANIGMRMISIGDQIKSGQDVDSEELQYLSKYFNDDGKDNTGKQVRPKTNWNDALPIRQNTNQQGGVDMDSGTKQSLGEGSPDWLAWTDNPIMAGLCSTVGSIITGVVSLALTIFSGGTAGAVLGFIGALTILPHIIDWLSNLIAGNAINVDEAAGAIFGNYADYGAALGGNAAAMQFGGTALTQPQQAALLETSSNLQNQERAQRSFFARAFDPEDSKSITGKLIDENRGTFSDNMAVLTQGFTHIASTVFHLPMTLANGKAQALTSYQYPFAIYGFSLDDQNNTAVADPYKNADAVGKILDSSKGQSYIDKAKACFGVTLSKGPASPDDNTMVWDAAATDNITETAYDGTYDNNGCKDTADNDWLKVRFFIFDTGIMEGYACAKFDDAQSCANDTGNGGPATSAATPATSTGFPTGDTISLATQISSNPNISFQTKQSADYFSSIIQTGHATTCGSPVIDPRLLQDLLVISQHFKIVLNVFTDGHQCDKWFHPKGLAVDLTGVNPLDGTAGTGNRIGDGPAAGFDPEEMNILRQFYEVAGGIMAQNGGGNIGQIQCFDTPPAPVNGVVFFHDACTHVHLDVAPAGADGH
jgi:hypothetical protein